MHQKKQESSQNVLSIEEYLEKRWLTQKESQGNYIQDSIPVAGRRAVLELEIFYV